MPFPIERLTLAGKNNYPNFSTFSPQLTHNRIPINISNYAETKTSILGGGTNAAINH
jgi:hypothetical protein